MCNAIDAQGRQTHILGGRPSDPDLLHKKVGALPIGEGDAVKQTNEIGMVIPVLEALDITGKTLTTDALLTQRKLPDYALDRGPLRLHRQRQPALAN